VEEVLVDPGQLAKAAVDSASDKKASDIILLDIRDVTTFADYFVICSGRSERHATVAAFNEAYFRRSPRAERGRLESLQSFFFPLDVVRGWNRIYGPRGFVQYQFVVPLGREDALRGVIELLSGAGVGSFLAVLKRFGESAGGPLAFPLQGLTLALDIPAAVPGLGLLLDRLDEVVAEAGGRVYLAKDSRLRPDVLAAMYPRLGEFEATRAKLDPDGVLRSDLARRLAVGAPARDTARAQAAR